MPAPPALSLSSPDHQPIESIYQFKNEQITKDEKKIALQFCTVQHNALSPSTSIVQRTFGETGNTRPTFDRSSRIFRAHDLLFDVLKKNNDKETLRHRPFHILLLLLLVMIMASVPNKAAVFRSIARSRRSSRRFQANRQIPDGVLRDILVRNE